MRFLIPKRKSILYPGKVRATGEIVPVLPKDGIKQWLLTDTLKSHNIDFNFSIPKMLIFLVQTKLQQIEVIVKQAEMPHALNCKVTCPFQGSTWQLQI